MIVNCYITNTFYVMNDLCSEFHPKRSCHCSSTAFQSGFVEPQNILTGSRFFLILIYFLRKPFGPREWACGLWINLLVYLFLSYLSHALLYIDFGETWTSLSLTQTLQVQLFSDLSCYLMLLQSILYTAE